MSLVSNSQTLSTTSTECVVPCKALKNALILKEDYDLTRTQLWIATDSIKFLKEIVVKKDELISNKDMEISLMRTNEEAYKGIIKEKDKQITEYERKYKSAKVKQYAGYGFGLVAAVVGLVLGI